MVWAWIGAVFFIICAISATIYIVVEADGIGRMIGIFAAWVVCAGIAFACLFWLYGTESGARSIKNFQSETSGGLPRIVSVYDVSGGLIAEYEGTFDIDVSTDKNRVIFDDENGKRHVIYYTTGTIIVDEVDE